MSKDNSNPTSKTTTKGAIPGSSEGASEKAIMNETVEDWDAEFVLASVADWKKVAAWLLERVGSPAVFLVSGSLGAGKTTFLSTLLHELGSVEPQVTSPTFSLCHHYKVQAKSSESLETSDVRSRLLPLQVQHWDFFRLESAEEIESSGFWEAWGELEGLARAPHQGGGGQWYWLEWPQRLGALSFPSGLSVWEVEVKWRDRGRWVQIIRRTGS